MSHSKPLDALLISSPAQAVAAARLGANVALATRIRDDANGRALLELLLAEGVSTQYVQLHDNALPWHLNISTLDISELEPAFDNARVVVICLDAPIESVYASIQLARLTGTRVLVDPTPPVRLHREMLRYVDLIKPNATETQTLTGIAATNRISALTSAQRLFENGVHAALVEAGNEGNLLLESHGTLWIPRFQVKTRDPRGAGAAMIGALALYMAEGRDLRHAALFASAAAAVSVGRVGEIESLPTRDDVLELLNTNNRGTTFPTEDSAA